VRIAIGVAVGADDRVAGLVSASELYRPALEVSTVIEVRRGTAVVPQVAWPQIATIRRVPGCFQ
jgi:hypothetical protein